MKCIKSLMGFVFILTLIAGAVPVLKNGFVTYSEGDRGERTLKYRAITDGKLGEARTIVAKGDAGGDIEGVISFDGKWIAFARKREALCPKKGTQMNINGEDDNHKYHCRSIYVARLDGKLPTSPIQVTDEGYRPSWGDDSFGPEKTLYYGVWSKGEVWKATINDVGSQVFGIVKHASIPDWDNGDHAMQCSPNGKLLAIRGIERGLIVMGLNETKHNKNIGGGDHPVWFADSKHFFSLAGQVSNIHGEEVANARNNQFGSSSNLRWAIAQYSIFPQSNSGWEIKYGAVEYNSTNSTITHIGPYDSEEVTEKGSWPDIHDFDGPAPFNTVSNRLFPENLKIESRYGQLIVNTTFPGKHTVELFDINGVRKANTVQFHSSRTVLSVKDYPKGMYILRVNSGGKSTQKKLVLL